MTDDRQEDDDLFNPEKLRVRGDHLATAQKLLTTVRVRRPSNQSFIRVHPGEEYRLDTVVLELKEEGEVYLLAPQLAIDLPGARVVRLHLYVDRNDNPALWPIPLPGADGRENEWHRSARIVAAKAMDQWVRIEADRAVGAYVVVVASGELPDPIWPKETLGELLRVAFGPDRFIRSIDHPVVKRLRGEV